MDPSTNKSLTYCATIPATTLSGLVYVMFLGLVGYIIPLASLIILYGKIYKTVWRRKSGQLGDSRPVEAFIRSRKKVLKMFLTVIFVFLLTWLPLLLYISAIEWTIKSSSTHVDYVRLITYSLGLCNSVCNPFIYALFNAKFRAGCKEMFSIKAFQRNKSLVDGNTASNAPPQAAQQGVLSRRGGFHGTKGEDKKKSEKETRELKKERKQQETCKNMTSMCQLIGRRLRTISDVDTVPKDSIEAIHLVSFQRTVDSGEIVLNFPGSESPETTNSHFSKSANNIKFKDFFFNDSCDSDGSDAQDNHKPAETKERATGKIKDGYSVLQDDHSSPFAARRVRSEGYTNDKTRRGFGEARNRSMPAIPP